MKSGSTGHMSELLGRFDASGRWRCTCGRTHVIHTRRVLLGEGVLESLPDLLRERFGGRARVWVLSDEHTERAAAGELKRLLGPRQVVQTVLPADPRPRCTPEEAAVLSGIVQAQRVDLILAVGGGSISDLGKKVSADTGTPNWCVATAPSVDAYTSGTSAVKDKGNFYSAEVSPSEVVVCPTSVMASAPQELVLAGLGDLLGKYVAYLDWNVAAAVAEEYICRECAELALCSARRGLEAGREIGTDRVEAVGRLADAALSSGLLMQALGSSRPAASAEHSVAHYWDVAGAVSDQRLNLHGLLVGAASRFVLSAYRSFFAMLPDRLPEAAARAAALSRGPHWEQTVVPEMQPFMGKMRAEMEGREPDAETLRKRLQAFAANREGLAELAQGILDELAGAIEALRDAGFPFDLRRYGLDPLQATLPFRHVRYLRNRYGCNDLMHELGLEEAVRAKVLASIEGELGPAPG